VPRPATGNTALVTRFIFLVRILQKKITAPRVMLLYFATLSEWHTAIYSTPSNKSFRISGSLDGAKRNPGAANPRITSRCAFIRATELNPVNPEKSC